MREKETRVLEDEFATGVVRDEEAIGREVECMTSAVCDKETPKLGDEFATGVVRDSTYLIGRS